jgi:AraC-like DNA-binding protein
MSRHVAVVLSYRRDTFDLISIFDGQPQIDVQSKQKIVWCDVRFVPNFAGKIAGPVSEKATSKLSLMGDLGLRSVDSLEDTDRHPMSAPVSVRGQEVESVEELRRVVPTARTEVTQVDRGRLQGNLTHLLIAGLPLNLGRFSLGVRSRGVVSGDRITIGMLIGRTNRVTHWSYDMQPADVVVWSPKAEHDARYYGGASVAVISLAASDLDLFFGSEPRLREPGTWIRKHYRPDGDKGARAIRPLREIVAALQANGGSLSADSAEFWKRAIVEAMTAPMLQASPSEMDGPPPSALRIVGKVEDYVDAGGLCPIHISEICSRLRVSRRTLHRAFHDAVGLGPIAFLRSKRLCAAHRTLRNSDPIKTTVTQVALEHGFANLGRFCGEYHSQFNEYPSRTLGVHYRR